jgi:hypothetical protein
MNKLGFLGVVIGFSVLAACGGTDPSASGVFPSQSFTGRSLRVEISGDATEWKAGTVVNFGADVTVGTVSVASPTLLFADVTVSDAAALGPRDVTVTASGSTFTMKGAFNLVSPIEVITQGAVAQGSLPFYTIINHDFDNPFDTTQSTDPTNPYPNLILDGPAGVDFGLGGATVSSYQISGFASIDVDAMAGPIKVTSGPASKQVVSSLGADFPVAARAPTALTSGAVVTGNIANPFDSELFSIQSSGTPGLVRFAALASGASGQAIVVLLGSSGHWTDLLGGGAAPNVVVPSAGTVYAITFDAQDASGYQYMLRGRTDAMVSVAEGNDTNNNTVGNAPVAASLPYIQPTSTLSSATDVDIVKFTTVAGDIGKRIHVVTTLGTDPLTDTQVDILQNGTSITDPNDLGPGPIDLDYGEDTISTPITAATTIQIRVELSGIATYNAAHSGYVLAFWYE